MQLPFNTFSLSVTNIPLWVTIIGTGLICSFYTALGGIKAVIWTDVFQFLVLFGSLIAVLIFGTKEAGGPSNVWNYNKNHSKLNFFVLNPDPTERLSLWSLIFGGAFNALPIWAVSQTAVQRFLTARTLKEAQKSVWYNLPGNVIMMTIVSLIGLVLFAYYKGDAPHMTTNDQILIYFVSGNLDQLQGLFIACLFAGTLSTVASGLNALAAVTLIDIVKAYRNGRQTITTFPAIDQASEEEAAKRLDYHDTVLSKLFTLGYGILTLALAFVAKYMGTLVQMANTVFGSIGGPLLGVFTLGVLYRRANSGGAIIGLMAGAYVGFWISVGALVNTVNGEVEENAFWLYRISFMWYSTASSLTTIIIGIITSEIIRRLIPDERYKEVDPLLLATFLGNFESLIVSNVVLNRVN
ncbi:putative sodium-dependent multivitamin transporter isoform X2 [Apostichopus japonicus]|uniref:Putative sodium-dependent multivitamin transporter isoform X2 n=1 Tax=Stichopus japonicus TaxID=307972 RepID=A0A2G8KBW8_STIJA|nr:putative sodium-dependent multivitamin transporter isoform X2 [Apostichopus japonicus]